jgi:hypothetical protein
MGLLSRVLQPNQFVQVVHGRPEPKSKTGPTDWKLSAAGVQKAEKQKRAVRAQRGPRKDLGMWL